MFEVLMLGGCIWNQISNIVSLMIRIRAPFQLSDQQTSFSQCKRTDVPNNCGASLKRLIKMELRSLDKLSLRRPTKKLVIRYQLLKGFAEIARCHKLNSNDKWIWNMKSMISVSV